MIRSILFCSTLVASSAVGAVALSVLHDNTFEVQTSGFVAPDASGSFVIPAFAPVRAQPSIAPASAKSIVAKSVMPLASIEPEVLFLTPVSVPNAALTPEVQAVATIAARPVPAAVSVTETPNDKPTVQRAAPERTVIGELPSPRQTAPIIVQQVSRTFSAAPVIRRAAVSPTYTIGVYR